MKKIKLFFIALSLAIMVVSCSSNNPETVAKKFLEASSKLDFEGAKAYCDESTGALLDMAAGFAKMAPKEEEREKVDFIILSSNVEDDKATVTYKTDKSEEEKTINLKKIDGDWKVSMGKEDMKKED